MDKTLIKIAIIFSLVSCQRSSLIEELSSNDIKNIKVYEYGTGCITINDELILYNWVNRITALNIEELCIISRLKYSTNNPDTMQNIIKIFENNILTVENYDGQTDNRLIICVERVKEPKLYISIVNQRNVIINNKYMVEYDYNILEEMKKKVNKFHSITPYEPNIIRVK